MWGNQVSTAPSRTLEFALLEHVKSKAIVSGLRGSVEPSLPILFLYSLLNDKYRSFFQLIENSWKRGSVWLMWGNQ